MSHKNKRWCLVCSILRIQILHWSIHKLVTRIPLAVGVRTLTKNETLSFTKGIYTFYNFTQYQKYFENSQKCRWILVEFLYERPGATIFSSGTKQVNTLTSAILLMNHRKGNWSYTWPVYSIVRNFPTNCTLTSKAVRTT